MSGCSNGQGKAKFSGIDTNDCFWLRGRYFEKNDAYTAWEIKNGKLGKLSGILPETIISFEKAGS